MKAEKRLDVPVVFLLTNCFFFLVADEQEDDNDRKELTQNELMSFARQIAVGMVSRKLFH